MNLKCPKCDYKWNFRGKAKRVQCPECKQFFYNPAWNPANSCTKPAQNLQIQDDIMRGNITEALDKANIDPFNNNGKISKDFIPLLLKNDKLKFAFAEYCNDKKKPPLWVVKKAVKDFLEKEGYYET